MASAVVQHAVMQTRGGAARVADMLHRGLGELGVASMRTFELAESAEGEAALAEKGWRERLAEAARAGAIIHLHATRDWASTMNMLAQSGARCLVTLHDASLVTGGCVQPLDCELFHENCAGECPRGYESCEAALKSRLEALRGLAPALATPSRWLKELAAPRLGKTPGVVPNGVEIIEQLPSREQAGRRMGLTGQAAAALFAAHGAERAGYKGGGDWLDLWQGVKRRQPRAVCFMAGGEETESRGDVRILPYMDQVRLRMVMRACTALLYPTRADNHPLVILEAMATGLPAVSFAVGGICEQIRDGETGLLVEPGNRAAFIEKAAWLLSRPREARVMGDAAQRLAERFFSAGRMCRDYAGIYDSLS